MPRDGIFAERAEKAGHRRQVAILIVSDWARAMLGKPIAQLPAIAAPAFSTLLRLVRVIVVASLDSQIPVYARI